MERAGTMNYIIAGVLIVIGLIDVFLSVTKQRTISQALQMLFPTPIDIAICVAGWVLLLVWNYITPIDKTNLVIISGFWGHIWWPNKERYVP